MDRMIATATVIRGKGACKIFMDGIVNDEVAKMSERYERKIEALTNELTATKNKETTLLAEKLPMIRACTAKRYGPFNNVRDKLEVAWAFVWYMGKKFKLFEDDRDYIEEEGIE